MFPGHYDRGAAAARIRERRTVALAVPTQPKENMMATQVWTCPQCAAVTRAVDKAAMDRAKKKHEEDHKKKRK